MMKKTREVIGLPVVELQEGKSLGRVFAVVVNPATRKVEALEVGERAILKTKTEFLPFTKLRSIGKDAVTVLSDNALEDEKQPAEAIAKCRLINTRVVTVDGTLAGSVVDYSFNPVDGSLAELYLVIERPRSYLAVPVSVVESIGRDFIIIQENYTEQIRQVNSPGNDHSAQQIVRSLESRAIEFALGRQIRNDVTDEQGHIILAKGEVVTSEAIDAARSSNRLYHLLMEAGVSDLLDGVDFTKEKLDTGSKRLMEFWHSFRDRSQEWITRKIEEDKSPTAELREIWYKLQNTLTQGGRELESTTKEKIRRYVVGKTLSQPVYDQDGTLLGARGDLVTEEMRDIADEAGRLQQLFLSAVADDVRSALDPIKQQIKDIINDKETS